MVFCLVVCFGVNLFVSIFLCSVLFREVLLPHCRFKGYNAINTYLPTSRFRNACHKAHLACWVSILNQSINQSTLWRLCESGKVLVCRFGFCSDIFVGRTRLVDIWCPETAKMCTLNILKKAAFFLSFFRDSCQTYVHFCLECARKFRHEVLWCNG